jgi:hypothetical protein
MVDPRPDRVPPEAIAKGHGLIRRLHEIATEFESLFHRRFTLDERLVGSLGEVLAAHRYDLDLYLPPIERHHGQCRVSGRQVQVKATRGDRVSLETDEVADFLIVLKLDENGNAEEFYNGPGALAWKAAGKPRRSDERRIPLDELRRLMEEVPEGDRIKAVR